MADLLRTESPSNIAWVGSVQAFLILFVGSVSGPIFDAGHFNFLLRTGSFCLVLGLFMTSLCKELWQLALAQGILTGLGGGMLFLPAIAIIPQYFTTRKSLATGIASVGSSSGQSIISRSSLPLLILVYRRYHLSNRFPQASTKNRFSMGNPCRRLHRPRNLCRCLYRNESPSLPTRSKKVDPTRCLP